MGCFIMSRSYQLRAFTAALAVTTTLAGMINQNIHESTFDRAPHQRYPSKNPGAFGIALHVDDSAGVYLEGIEFGFQVVVIDPRDVDWARKVLDAAENL